MDDVRDLHYGVSLPPSSGVSVLLLKSSSGLEDPYVQVLSNRDVQAVCLPLLHIRHLPVDPLRKALRDPALWSGLILTSKNAVAAISNGITVTNDTVAPTMSDRLAGKASDSAALTSESDRLSPTSRVVRRGKSTSTSVAKATCATTGHDLTDMGTPGETCGCANEGDVEKLRTPEVLEARDPSVNHCESDLIWERDWNSSVCRMWGKRKVFVVGKATGKAARSIGLVPYGGENCGSACSLCSVVEREMSGSVTDKPLLFPCGNLRRDELPSTLQSKGYSVHCLPVYETVSLEGSVEQLRDAVANVKDDGVLFLVYFSPSGIQFTADLLREKIIHRPNVKLVAIGQTTAAEMDLHGFPVFSVCAKPDPESLVTALGNIQTTGSYGNS